VPGYQRAVRCHRGSFGAGLGLRPCRAPRGSSHAGSPPAAAGQRGVGEAALARRLAGERRPRRAPRPQRHCPGLHRGRAGGAAGAPAHSRLPGGAGGRNSGAGPQVARWRAAAHRHRAGRYQRRGGPGPATRHLPGGGRRHYVGQLPQISAAGAIARRAPHQPQNGLPISERAD
nr:hypothetical protein [Tanacetum cinerariifolium]